MFIARQWLGKHVPAVMDIYAMIGKLLEAVFSVWFMLRLYNKAQQDQQSLT
jgi:hypothetical protein